MNELVCAVIKYTKYNWICRLKTHRVSEKTIDECMENDESWTLCERCGIFVRLRRGAYGWFRQLKYDDGETYTIFEDDYD